MEEQYTLFNFDEIQDLESPFEAIKQVDEQGKEWWNSRALAGALGYTKYLNFQRLEEQVLHSLQIDKGLSIMENVKPIEEMVSIGNGRYRRVVTNLLSRTVCMAICINSEKKKPMAKVATQYFQSGLSTQEIARGVEGNVLMYRSSTGKVNISVIFNQNNFWLSQKRMSELFGTTIPNINYHLKSLSESGEMQLSDKIRKIRIPSDKSEDSDVMLYNLDAVIAVGYRINSHEAMQFRMWATAVLKEYMIKGYAMDDERLKGKPLFGYDYFDELLERIREIRTSERRYYQKITDIYAECSADYDKNSELTKYFYSTVQNMMHYAVTHQTAAEIVYDRVDSEKPYMGLTSWKNAPDGRIVKSDVTVAKNYLSEQEVSTLEHLSTAFVDIAQTRAEQHVLMTMNDWRELLVKYLQLGNYDILDDSGAVSHEQAQTKAWEEYEKYRIIQDQTFLSDFDKMIKLL